MLLEFLQRKQKEIERHVVSGTQPQFGYPNVCYDEYDGTTRDKEIYVQEMCEHIFNPCKTSFSVIIEGIKKHKRLYNDM